MPDIPDPDYHNRTVRLNELRQGTYKERVRQESRGHDYRKFIKTRSDFNYVILENIRKARILLDEDPEVTAKWSEIDLASVLNKQLNFLHNEYLQVLCTCVMYIYDYNSNFLFQE